MTEKPEGTVQISQLKVDEIQYLLDQLKDALPVAKKLEDLTTAANQTIADKVASFALSLRTSKLDPTFLEDFFKHPYFLLPVPRRQETWLLYMPRFVDMQIGYLQSQTPSYNVFLVNRYAEWLGGIPEALKKELNLKTPLELKLEGDLLFGSQEAQKEAWKRYPNLLKSQDKEGIRVDPKRAFELIAALVRDGILPFSVKPIPKEDLVEREGLDFQLREYQLEAWETFKQFSNAGIYWPPSAGKTFITLYAMAHLKPPFLIAVPTLALKEQWEERIALHLPFLKPEDFVVGTYHYVIKNCMNRRWSLMAIDEVQHLPADEFARMSVIQRDRTLGLSATPQREDEREHFIFALTGKPIGLSWDSLKRLGVIKNPTVHVWLLKNDEARFKKLADLLSVQRKTLIFSDSIEIGKMIAKRHEIPFVYGETKNERMKTIKEAEMVVVSRVGDEGISLPDISRVIEVSWLFGSRRQELQRFGRLLHSTLFEDQLEHHILMTASEYQSSKKRFFSIMDKGFKIVLHQDEESERVIQREAADLRNTQLSLPGARRSQEYRRPAPQQTRPPAVLAPVESDVLAIYQRLGFSKVPRIRSRMTGPQQRVFDFFIQNDGKFYSTDKLWRLMDYGSKISLGNMDLGQMVKNGWIEKRKDTEGTTVYGTQYAATLKTEGSKVE